MREVGEEEEANRAGSGPVNGITAVSQGRRQSLSPVLDRLRGCEDAWCPSAPWDREGAHSALWGRPAGSFLVVRHCQSAQPNLLCVSTGGESKAIADYPIHCTGTAFQLSQSRLGFSDVAQLVLFYSLSRDVLSVCLSIPVWIYTMTDQTESRLSQLGPKSWLCPTPDLLTDPMTHRQPSTVMCTIQLTTANGALCVINPLYLHEHGDDWLTEKPTSTQRPTHSTNYRRERRLSTTRPWEGAGLRTQRAISLVQAGSAAGQESPGLIRAQSAESPQCPPTPPSPTEGVVLRRPSRDAPSNPLRRAGSQGGLAPTPTTPSTPSSRPVSDSQLQGSPVPQSPHRVSWIEDGVWLPLSTRSSLLQPPLQELDSLSISSIEEEQEAQASSSPAHNQPPANRLADKVRNRLSAVGQAIGGLVCQQKRLTNRVQELSERRGGAFADAVKAFVETTMRGGVDPDGVTGLEYLQEVRSSLTALKEMLLDYPDVQVLLESMTDTPDWEIDALVELALHRVALRPVSAHLYSSLQTARCHDGSLPRLRGNQRVLEARGVEDLGGSAGAGVPDPPTLERMQQRWSSMHDAYSPSKKVLILLKVCKSIYHSMSTNASPGAVFGADDFLPCLTWVLLRSDVGTLQLDTDYMMELLDPSQLQGEGGYYLTSLYASLYYISSFRPRLAVRQLSMEAQQSLDQWHRRRTLHCNQARRRRSRRTIRRPATHGKAKNHKTHTGSTQEAGGESDSVETAPSSDAADSPQAETKLETLEPVRVEEPGRGQEAVDQSNPSVASPQYPSPRQRDALLDQEDDGQSARGAGVESDETTSEEEKEERGEERGGEDSD